MKVVLPLISLLILLTGCQTKEKHKEFVKTITFSNLETFNYAGIVFEGLELEGDDEKQLTGTSKRVVLTKLAERGFEPTNADGDFTVVVVWRKVVSAGYDKFDSVHELNDFAAHRDSIGHRISILYDLSIEMFQPSTGYRFWEKKLSKVFKVLELSEYRIEEAITLAIENFPTRVEKDSNLPDIQ